MFKEGDKVFSPKFGYGTVSKVWSSEAFSKPVQVKFETSKVFQSYDHFGRWEKDFKYDIRNIKLIKD